MAYEYNILLKEGLQKKTTSGSMPPDVSVTPAEINTLDGIKTDTTIQQQINNLQNYADVNVKNWSEFLAAVDASKTIPCRIHFTANISVSTSATLDLSNAVVYAHYNRWIVNGHTVTLTGNYAYFYDVLFQGASNGYTSTPAFSFVGLSSTSCTFSFENCRFYNFLETATNNVFVNVNGATQASIHTVFIRCTINGEASTTYGRALAIRKYSGAAVSLKVVNLLYSAKKIETNKVSMISASGLNDLFVADGSCEYVGTKPVSFYQWGVSTAQSGVQIHYVNGGNITSNNLANIDVTGWNVNDVVVIGNMTSTTYLYVNNNGISKTFNGSSDFDLCFRYCGNYRYQSLNVSLIA